MNQNMPAALSVNEAAAYLSISRANLYRLFKNGSLKPAKIGGRTLVRRVDADSLLAGAIEQPVPARANKAAKIDCGIFR